MTFFDLFATALSLSMDATAVALCAGASGFLSSWRSSFRMALHFGLFQAGMPVLGWLAGVTIIPFISALDHWIAFFLLTFVALRMIRSGFSKEEATSLCDPSRGKTLVLLSVATSIDALAIGFSLAILSIKIWMPALLIGITTFMLSLAAARLGSRLNLRFGKVMEIAGGIILFLIGFRILFEHLFLL